MALSINTNTAALNAHRQLEIANLGQAQSMEKLSSGYRINRAKDDVAGMAQSQSLESAGKSLTVASRNTTQANAMLQTAEGGADQIQKMLIRLKELATQASSSNANSNLADIQTEASAVKNEIDRIAKSTNYLGSALLTGFGSKSVQSGVSKYQVANVTGFDVSGAAQGNYLISGTSTQITMWNAASSGVAQTLTVASGAQTLNFSTMGISFSTTATFTGADNGVSAISVIGTGLAVTGGNATFQVGQTNNVNFQISFAIADLQYNALGSTLTIQNISVSTLANAQSSMNAIDIAVDQVNTARANIGGTQNRLDYTYANLQTTMENFSSAESVIRDVDMAAEMTKFTKNSILSQAGTAMLAQANSAPQQILSLLK